MPETESCKVIGQYFRNMKNKWQNGFMGSDGCVYGIPQNWPGVLRIDMETEEVTALGEYEGKDKWEGGVVDREGNLWCMPLRAKKVLRVAPPGRPKTGKDSS
eukprot:scaffold482_cov247-Pinguiococcus_pyrenoidosus.AAC.4